MENIKLVFPQIGHERLWRGFVEEFEQSGEEAVPSVLFGHANYGDFLTVLNNAHNAVNLPALIVPETTYFCVDELESKIFGAVSIRHSLNQTLLLVGGNVGYGVKPSERRKGYGVKMLALALEICRGMGMDRVLITCDKNNTGSCKVILKNGGVMEDEWEAENGRVTQRYWVALNIGKPDGVAPLTAANLPVYAEVIRKSFATVARDFGLTRENCPRHTSFVTNERLAGKIGDGYYPFGYFRGGKIVGFASLTDTGNGVFELNDVSVLPEYRHYGCGKELLDFCKKKAVELGGEKIQIGIIEENEILKNWYSANGFKHTGTKRFEHLLFTAGYMEWRIISFVYGTTNPAKLASMKKILSPLAIEVIGLNEIGTDIPDVDENGATPLENARIKALAYYGVLKRSVFACDTGLYIDGIPDNEQPDTHVRVINGRRLSDDEMVAHYSAMAKRFGGKVKARYKNAICLVAGENKIYEHFGGDISSDSFYIVAEPHEKRVEGFPLDCLSVHIESGKYYYDMGNPSKGGSRSEEGFRAFFRKVLESGAL